MTNINFSRSAQIARAKSDLLFCKEKTVKEIADKFYPWAHHATAKRLAKKLKEVTASELLKPYAIKDKKVIFFLPSAELVNGRYELVL